MATSESLSLTLRAEDSSAYILLHCDYCYVFSSYGPWRARTISFISVALDNGAVISMSIPYYMGFLIQFSSSYEAVTFMIPNLQMQKLRFREIR